MKIKYHNIKKPTEKNNKTQFLIFFITMDSL